MRVNRLFPHLPLAEDPSVERIDGPTAHGGAYGIVYYRDHRGNPVPKEWAVGHELHVHDEDGKLLSRHFG